MAITPQEYIDQATSPDDRATRKAIMFPWLYGAKHATIAKIAESLNPHRAQELLNEFNANFRHILYKHKEVEDGE